MCDKSNVTLSIPISSCVN